MTRRTALASLGALAAPALGRGAAPMPPLCIFSKHLSKIEYTELGAIAKELGFDGVDLTVRPGGHVNPYLVSVDLVRAIESIRGAGIDVPMITTALISPNDPTARPILALAGRSKVPYFKLGYWKYGVAQDIQAQLAGVRRDVFGLSAIGRQYGIAAGFHNHSGDNVGEAVWDIQTIIADMDPRWIGYYFDPCHATAEGGVEGWDISLRLALPRLKMIAIKDFYWAKTDGKWTMRMCPLGEGMVNWQKFFAMVARGGFSGPISLHLEYNPKDELNAIRRDLEFARKQIHAAYGGGVS